jgi:hypothetical protein
MQKVTDILYYLKTIHAVFLSWHHKIQKAFVFEEISAFMQSTKRVKLLATPVLFAETSLAYTDYICN